MVSSRRSKRISFECKRVLDNFACAYFAHARFDGETVLTYRLNKVLSSLCKQTYAFIALGGITSMFEDGDSRQQIESTASTIIDSLLLEFECATLGKMRWPELNDYLKERHGPDFMRYHKTDYVLNHLSHDVTQGLFDFVKEAIAEIAKTMVKPLTLGEHLTLANVDLVSDSRLIVMVTLLPE